MNLSDFADLGGATKTAQLIMKRKGSKTPVVVHVRPFTVLKYF